jgi:hypothetical protein
MAPVIALLAAALFSPPPDAAHVPPAAPLAHLAGPADFCAVEFSVRLERGESMDWTPLARGGINYVMHSGPTVATIARHAGRLPPEAAMTPLRLPFSPVSRRRVYAMPERTETNREGDVRSSVTFGIEYLLHGATATVSPLMVLAVDQDQHARIPFVGRIDPRPLAQRRCTPAWSDRALVGRITFEPGR